MNLIIAAVGKICKSFHEYLIFLHTFGNGRQISNLEDSLHPWNQVILIEDFWGEESSHSTYGSFSRITPFTLYYVQRFTIFRISFKILDESRPQISSPSHLQPSKEDELYKSWFPTHRSLENRSVGSEFFAFFSKSMMNQVLKFDPLAVFGLLGWTVQIMICGLAWIKKMKKRSGCKTRENHCRYQPFGVFCNFFKIHDVPSPQIWPPSLFQASKADEQFGPKTCQNHCSSSFSWFFILSNRGNHWVLGFWKSKIRTEDFYQTWVFF